MYEGRDHHSNSPQLETSKGSSFLSFYLWTWCVFQPGPYLLCPFIGVTPKSLVHPLNHHLIKITEGTCPAVGVGIWAQPCFPVHLAHELWHPGAVGKIGNPALKRQALSLLHLFFHQKFSDLKKVKFCCCCSYWNIKTHWPYEANRKCFDLPSRLEVGMCCVILL